MDHSGAYTFVPTMGSGNHNVHPWVQGQRIQQPEEQYIPSTIPSYSSQINLPSTSYTQNRTINDNYEFIACEQRTGLSAVNTNCQLTIPIELLGDQSIFQALPGLKEIVFLGPHPASSEYFLNSKEFFMRRAILVLQNAHFLKKVTFSLDFTHFNEILEILNAIPDMEEIVLTLPTAVLQPDLRATLKNQQGFVDGLRCFSKVNRLTIPMEFVTAFLLSHLANLPRLESLTVSYSAPPRSPHHPPFPEWSSYRDPAECPGIIFLGHLKAFDPRGYFKQLLYLDLGAPLSDIAYTTLERLFPRAHIR